MAKRELVIERRGLFLGKTDDYIAEIKEALSVLGGISFIDVDSEEELIEKCYTYEPMLILMELDLDNINIVVNAAMINKYRQAVSVGLAPEEGESYRGLTDEFVITDYVVKTGEARKDALNVLRAYKLNVKYGINVKTITKKMPIVTDLIWNDSARDEKFSRMALAEKLERLGVRRELAGHKYLIAAIAMQDAMHIWPEPAKLYANVAEYFGTTPAAVERDIRYAIETAWIVGDIDYQHKMFGMSIDEEKGKPTNSEFIARLALDY
ncbi:MAG: sporulation initiation factor Spo0A C-terminal domain-containing protein [Clostridiales bacterium]|nr:sporulation initiation factor Spo0A C-terminal domain-containing protein [Clostridiales bacterium]